MANREAVVINDSVDVVPIDTLSPWPRNPRNGDLEAIVESIRANGFYGTLTVQKSTRHILAGNHRWMAALELGIKEVPVVWVDVDDEMAARINLVDNRTANLGQDDEVLIAEILNELPSLEGTGYDDESLEELLANIEKVEREGLSDPDALPDAPEEPVTKRGDVWLLGRHRVMCGDSTSVGDVESLMLNQEANIVFTSPPYDKQRDYGGQMSDWQELMTGVFGLLPVTDNVQVLVNLGLIHRNGEWQPYWDGWIKWMQEYGWRRFGWYVWDQGPGLPGDWNGRLAPSHEFIFHFNRVSERARKTKKSKHAGSPNHGSTGLRAKDGTVSGYTHVDRVVQDTKIGDSVIRVMRHKARGIEVTHPAVFPVELAEEMLTSFSDVGSLAYEPFGGSGSTLIAAEKTGRTCYAMELSEKYVDVTCRRFQEYTGTLPVLESTGEEHDFVSKTSGN